MDLSLQLADQPADAHCVGPVSAADRIVSGVALSRNRSTKRTHLRGPLVHLRSFIDTDAPVINRLAVEAFSQYSDKYNDWPALAKVMERMSDMAKTAKIIVAEHEGRIIGAVGYLPPFGAKGTHFKPEWPIVRMLVVDPQARGLGGGRALTDACIDRARRDRAPEIALHTSEMMTVALPMYLRMGFERVSDAPPLFGVPFGIYVKRLDV